MAEPIVYTSTDKAKRDELFRELRTKGTPAERQVVRFSGVEQVAAVVLDTVVRNRWVLNETETRIAHRLVRLDDGKWHLVPFERTKPRKVYVLKSTATTTERPTFRSTFSVSHPADSLGGN